MGMETPKILSKIMVVLFLLRSVYLSLITYPSYSVRETNQ